ncbi:hypothetical protein RhiirC2_783584 [Rhizophagus irregularis]|uniref:Dynein heavy chain tail domain-containing protein n=1 Tax=Rhizophagus irregularis TaxID=588596 RepID=A0A2N1N0F4_9GLOM|nr:hypothetical protein RhiirC2_783584 [Rhizophagus irregularis]
MDVDTETSQGETIAGGLTTTSLQIHCGLPYEALHSYIHLAVAPYFDAYARARERDANEGLVNIGGKKHNDSKIDIPMVKKKITELELSLLLSQQNVEISEISLNIYPVVQKTVEECREKGKRVTVNMIENQALLTDSTFLNKLQADVNGWIKEIIKKVTKLSRDPASSTAIQEINFWLSMEKALEGIDEHLKGDHIELTLGILRHAKHYHTTVSFIADTGLKESKEKVNKYNQLMKDFPLDELLSAPDVNKIKESLDIIFTHLKKLRLSTYPIKKALVLVEAISRDLNDQLPRVLGNRELMYMEYEDFEKIMSGAEDRRMLITNAFHMSKICVVCSSLLLRWWNKPTWVDNVKGGAERIVDNDGIINYLIILLKHGPNSSNYIGNSRYSKLAAANEY